jgi:hypothetical protein
MELILSGYGSRPENTIACLSLTGDTAKVLWQASIENASFVCEGDGFLFTVTEASEYAAIYLFQRVGAGFQLLDQRKGRTR